MSTRSLGEIAYNAYCQSRSWVSVRGEKLPPFRDQCMELRKAWEDAARAVASEVEEKFAPCPQI